MTQAQAERWVGKTLYSSDGKNLGDIASIERTGDKVTEVRADIGGFLGFGETRIRLMPNQVKFAGDSATTTLSQAEAKALPGIDK